VALEDYQIDTAALLHDQNNLYTGLYQLNRWINQARDQVAQDTGCLRVNIAGQPPFGGGAQPGSAVPGGAIPGQVPSSGFFTIAGQEMYPYSFANETLKQQYQGLRAVCDVGNVAVSWGGAIRPVQEWMPWDELQAYARSYNIGVFSYPFVWSNVGSAETGQVWMWPAPSITSEMEWDAICLPIKLYSNSDYDALPGAYRYAVSFWAANLAKLSSNQFAAATEYKQEYYRQIITAAGASERARVRSFYKDWTDW
jgi:hypothetical protein